MLPVIAALVASAVVTACGHPFVPKGYSPTKPYNSNPVSSVVPASKIPPFRVGVDLFITQNYSLTQTKTLGTRVIEYLAKTLKVQAVGIAWTYEVPSKTANEVIPGPYTPAVADIQELTSIAKHYGLQVEYRVLFRVGPKAVANIRISPTDRSAWIKSLFATEAPALHLAQDENISEFVAGTETHNLEGSPDWNNFFAKASAVYHGVMSYATWGGMPGKGGYFSQYRVMPPVSLYGATTYPKVVLPDTASVGQLTTQWVGFLKNVPSAVLERTAIDEVGIPAVTTAYTAPWAWLAPGGTLDPQVQANWFQAACTAAGIVHMRAIYFWDANLADDPAHPKPASVKFEARPASEAAIKACYSTEQKAAKSH